MSIIKEFKEFAIRGNAIDMAVGITVGAAFGKIVTSFVNDIVMPPIGFLIKGVNFSKLSIMLKPSGDLPEVTLNYGSFIQNLFDFLIVAFVIFTLIKLINTLKRPSNKVGEEEIVIPKTQEEILLEEIRDILKSGSKPV